MSRETEREAGIDSLTEHLHETTDWSIDRCMRIARILDSFGDPDEFDDEGD